jgi:TPP-dependent pyruvate/acetoin dehydrogenase alpha subunit
VKDEVRAAVEWADQSPVPPVEELYTDVYVEQWGPYSGTNEPEMLKE